MANPASPQMPHKTAARLRELIQELERAQSESGDLADRARQELSDLARNGELRPVGTGGEVLRTRKAGRKKR